MKKEYIDVCERLGWSIFEDGSGWVDLTQHSPAGEEHCFTVSSEAFVEKVRAYADDYNADEHAALLLILREERGIPYSMHEVSENAEAIGKMLQELADALEEAEKVPLPQWKLGEDLCVEDNLMDGITFKDLIVAMHCNHQDISWVTIMNTINEILYSRKEDMIFLLEKNLDAIMAEARKGRA